MLWPNQVTAYKNLIRLLYTSLKHASLVLAKRRIKKYYLTTYKSVATYKSISTYKSILKYMSISKYKSTSRSFNKFHYFEEHAIYLKRELLAKLKVAVRPRRSQRFIRSCT